MTNALRRRPVLPLLLAAYCGYAALFIYSTSFVIDGVRYFSLFDDAMISMRYAQNLASGHGLVWNPGGPRVEGFTNPLWVAYMAVVHLLPIPASKISLAIQATAAVCLLLNLIVVHRIASRLVHGSVAFSGAAVLLTALYLPLNNWALQGMEVGALALLTSLAAWRMLRSLEEDAFSVQPYLWLAAGTLVRIDMVVPLLAAVTYLVIFDTRHRRQHLAWGLAIPIVCLLPQTLLRYWYFGRLLPNTYYLKMQGYPPLLRVSRGALVSLAFVWRMNFLLFLAPFSLLWLRRDHPVKLFLWVFLATMGYSIYVGGDAWENWGGANRYICVAISLFFVLFAVSLFEWSQRLRSSANVAPRYVHAALCAITLAGVVNLNLLKGPPSLAEWLLLKRPLLVAGNEEMVRTALLVRELTDDKARIAVVWAGALPYFSERESIDMLGKTDAVLAREPMHAPGRGLSRLYAFHPGHLKWDYRYSIGEQQPDVIVDLWESPDEAEPYLRGKYSLWQLASTSLYLRRDSPRIHWDRVRRLGSPTAIL